MSTRYLTDLVNSSFINFNVRLELKKYVEMYIEEIKYPNAMANAAPLIPMLK